MSLSDWKQRIAELEEEARKERFWLKMDRVQTLILIILTLTLIGLIGRSLL